MRIAAGVVLLAGCYFDPAGVPYRAGDDGGVLDGSPADAALCETTTATIRVDGAPHASATAPATTVLVGDTVILSSEGSCGPAALTYEWDISPINATRDTIRPDHRAGAVSVYATEPGAYVVTLTVVADDESAASTIYAFDARGFAELSPTPDRVRDLDVGDDRLWIASERGTFRADLADLAAGGDLTSVDDEVDGPGPARPPTKVDSVLWDEAREALWIGGFDPAAGVWRVDYGADGDPPVSRRIDYDALFGADARTTDLAIVVEDETATVAAATDRGAAFAPEGDAFETSFVPEGDAAGGAAEAGETWVLGDRLHAIDTDRDFLVFDGGNPTGIVADLDGAGLWVTADMRGVAHVRVVGDGVDVARYDAASGLPSRNVRAIAIERAGRFAGDVWVATDRGLARWKADRAEWVPYGNPQGLMGYLDLRAIATSTPDDGPRQVFAGGNAGLVYAALP